MAKVKPSEAFEQAWDGSMRSATAIEIQSSVPQLKDNKAFAEAQVARIKALFSERKKIERALFNHLRGVLGREKELVDLLSGDAVATIPLLLTEDLRQLHLVDNGHSKKQNAVSNALAKKLGVHGKVRRHDVTISETTSPFLLPPVRINVLADTGFSLPEANRMPQTPSGVDMSSPQTFRGSHVVGATATFKDILRVLDGGSSGRTLHVVETPFVRAPLSLNAWGDHLGAQLDSDSRWQIKEVAPLLEETGTMRAVLELT